MIEIIMVAAPETKVRLKASVRWGVFFRIEAQVPFPHDVIVITQFAKVFRQELFLKGQSSWFGTF